MQCATSVYFPLSVLPKAERGRRGLLQYADFVHFLPDTDVPDLGRAFHHLNLLHLAVPYYEKVPKMRARESLTTSQALTLSSEGESLRMEAAFNLSSMYLASGNPALARNILREHCTV